MNNENREIATNDRDNIIKLDFVQLIYSAYILFYALLCKKSQSLYNIFDIRLNEVGFLIMTILAVVFSLIIFLYNQKKDTRRANRLWCNFLIAAVPFLAALYVLA